MISKLEDALIKIGDIKALIKVQIRYGFINTKKINNINDLLRYISAYNELPTCNLVEIISDKEIKRTRNSQI